MVFVYELKSHLASCEQELYMLKAQYETFRKTLEIPERLRTHVQPTTHSVGKVVMNKSISDIIDVVGTGNTPPVRKRKAALEQGNVLKKLKGIKNHQRFFIIYTFLVHIIHFLFFSNCRESISNIPTPRYFL